MLEEIAVKAQHLTWTLMWTSENFTAALDLDLRVDSKHHPTGADVGGDRS